MTYYDLSMAMNPTQMVEIVTVTGNFTDGTHVYKGPMYEIPGAVFDDIKDMELCFLRSIGNGTGNALYIMLERPEV